MSTYEVQSKIAGHIIAIGAALTLAVLIVFVVNQDAADDRAVCAQADEQAKVAAQSETWARLDQNFNGGEK